MVLLDARPEARDVECASSPVVQRVDGLLTVAEVAERTGVSAHALRYYERVGLLSVPRDDAGRRLYGRVEVGRIVFISLLRATGMPIRDLRAYFGLVAAGPGNEADRLAILTRRRDQVLASLKELRAALDLIELKIAVYGG